MNLQASKISTAKACNLNRHFNRKIDSRSMAWKIFHGRPKSAAMMAGRYAHAKQFNRHQRQLRILRSRLGRIIRDVRRKIKGHATLEEAFALPLGRATQIRSRQQRQRGWKLYSFHAPEVECIGKGKAVAPHESGVKASIVTNNRRAVAARQPLRRSHIAGRP
ncbi:hypothetical protein ACVMB1_000300 [Bradyrhizobium sp. USDA 4504]